MPSITGLAPRFIAGFFLACMFATGSAAPAAAQSGGAVGTLCADEGGRCSFRGAAYVHYGANDRYAVRLLSNGVECTNAVFGDPVPGVHKACYVARADAVTPIQRGVSCAGEDQRCSFRGTAYVYYGANDRYAVRLLSNGTECTNTVFGDPVPGVRKACYVERAVTARNEMPFQSTPTQVTIQTINGNYLTAVNGGGVGGPNTGPLSAAIHTDATSIGPWETFTCVRVAPPNRFAFRTGSGTYLTRQSEAAASAGPMKIPGRSIRTFRLRERQVSGRCSRWFGWTLRDAP